MCVDTVSFEIFNNTQINFDILDINNSLECYLDSTGFVELGVQNGTGPYVFDLVLDGDTLATQSNNIFNNLTIGDYIVHLTDAEDCHQQLSFTIVTDEVIPLIAKSNVSVPSVSESFKTGIEIDASPF